MKTPINPLLADMNAFLKLHRVTQEEFAQGAGITRQYLRMCVKGLRQPSDAVLDRIRIERGLILSRAKPNEAVASQIEYHTEQLALIAKQLRG